MSHRIIAVLLLCFGATPALSQPTPAQQDAIRSNCRSDFLSNCSGVPRGGREALQCLQNNFSKLSAACKTAVSVTMPQSAPAAQPAAAPPPAPTPTPAQPAAAPAAPAPAPATASAPPAPAPAAAPAAPPPARQPAAAPTPTRAPPARTAAPAAPAAKPAAAPPAATPTPAVTPAPMPPLPPLPPRVLLQVSRACKGDQDAVCPLVRPGDGRVIECLLKNEPALSAACKQALATARQSAR